MRKSASAGETIPGTFNSGQEIEVQSVSNGWAKVRFYGKIGNVSDKYITPLPQKETAKPEPKPAKEVVEKIDAIENDVPASN